MDVGDFDNDGAVDIVLGNAGFVWGYDPVDIQYFRYDSTNIYNFTQNWLQTGTPLSCVTPVINDLDNDGYNELYAGGLFTNGGSAFVWEGTGTGSGYVAWLDATSSPNIPNESAFGYVDYYPSIVAVHIIPWLPDDSQLLLWSCQNSTYSNVWQSPIVDSVAYRNLFIIDMDNDEKKSILLAGYWKNMIRDWEQVSSGIITNQSQPNLQMLELHSNYPNPFNYETVIPYECAYKTEITITITH